MKGNYWHYGHLYLEPAHYMQPDIAPSIDIRWCDTHLVNSYFAFCLWSTPDMKL